MAEAIDYSKRGVLQNLFDPGAWKNLLNTVDSVVDPAVGVWQKIDQIDADQAAKITPAETPVEQSKYDPNFSASDFAFTPNWYLIGFGLVLLAGIYVFRK